jgi:DNA-binding MarR family transcriptional regulator
MERLNRALRPFQLTFPRYEALMILYLSKRGSMPLGKLGNRLQVHPTSVTSLMDGLEKKGFISRYPHESDRRMTLAAITPAGRKVAEAATHDLNANRFYTDPFRSTNLDAVIDLLRPFRAHADGFSDDRTSPRSDR